MNNQSLPLNTFITGNNIDVLKTFPDESIDLIVTSPPYDNLRNYNGFLMDLDNLIPELYRVLKTGGTIVWVVNDSTKNGSESGNSFRQVLKFIDNQFKLHDTMIYAKKNYLPLNHKRYEQQFEYMFVFVKGKIKTFNPITEPCSTYGENNRTRHRKDKEDLIKSTGFGKPIKKEKIKSNIWYYSVGAGNSTTDKEAFKHPAIFPEKLAQDHILSWSNENDVVLDIFSGSGTVGKMAVLNNRHFIGIELNKEYNDIAEKRLSKYIKKEQPI